MKLPQEKKFGANADERETYLPKQFGSENKFDEEKRK